MTQLTQEKCMVCNPGAPPVTEADQKELKPQIPDWTLAVADGHALLTRTYTFPDFVSGLAFTNQVGDLAESEGHHPALLTEWGKVTVTWWTHAINGLHRNDFIMAAKTDQIYATQR